MPDKTIKTNSTRKIFQLYRNETVYTPSEGHTALDVAKTALSQFTLNDGEIVIGRYQETNDDVKTVIGVVHDMSNNEGITFFTDSSNFVSKPVVLYQTDGTTGLLGVNPSQLGNNWQLVNYDFSPYKYLRCYFKMGNFSTNGIDLTPSTVIELPLDTESKAKSASDSTETDPKQPCDMYIAGGVVPNPSDPTNILSILVAVDTTKTKFQVISQLSYDEWQYDENYNNTPTPANNNGRFLYKIEGCYDTLNNASSAEFVEHDPVFTASAAYNITNSDVNTWRQMASEGRITGIVMNNETKGTSGIVDLGTVVTTETDPTVPNWAKSATKPSYTASEVGAVPTTRTINSKALSGNITLTPEDIEAQPETFIVQCSTSGGNWLSDKTNAEIFTAYGEGKEIYVIVESDYIGMISGVPGQNYAVFTVTPYDEPNVKMVFIISTNNNVQTVTVGTNVFLESNPTNEKRWSQQQVWFSFDGEIGTGASNPITFYDENGTAVSVSTVKDTFNDPSKNVILYDGFNCYHRNIDYDDTYTNWTFSSLAELQSSNNCYFYSVTFNYSSSLNIIYKTKDPLFQCASALRTINGLNLTNNILVSNYTTQSNSSESAAITALVSNFSTSLNGSIIAVKFNYNVPANATLNLSSKGAKPIYYRGSAITAGIINAGDIATFIYSSSTPQRFILIANDAWINQLPAFTSSDNGKILGVVNGQLAWVSPTTIYTGSGTPSSSQGNDGDIYLQTN